MKVIEARELLQRAKDAYVERKIMDSITECHSYALIESFRMTDEKKSELIDNGFTVDVVGDVTKISWE